MGNIAETISLILLLQKNSGHYLFNRIWLNLIEFELPDLADFLAISFYCHHLEKSIFENIQTHCFKSKLPMSSTRLLKTILNSDNPSNYYSP